MLDYQSELEKLNLLIKDAETGVLPITQSRLTTLYNTRSMLGLYLYIKPTSSIKQIKKLALAKNFTLAEVGDDPLLFKKKLKVLIKRNLGIYSDLDLLEYMLLQLKPFIDKNKTFVDFSNQLRQFMVLEKGELRDNLASFGDHLLAYLQSQRSLSYEEQHSILNLVQICKNRRFFRERRYLWPLSELHPDPNDLESPFNARNVRPPLHHLLQAVNFSIVYVSTGFGAGPGLGHTLLHLGEDKGYVHINGLYNYPIYVSDAHFRDFYLDKWQKRVIAIQKVNVPNPDGAMRELVQLCQKTWLWGGPLHNCFHFCKQILLAGGASLKEIDGFCVPNHRLLQQALIDFAPLDLSQWTPPDYSSSTESDPDLNLFKTIPIQEWTSQSNGTEQLLDKMISNLGNLYIWQKPLQKERLEKKLDEIKQQHPSTSHSLHKQETLIQKIGQLDSYTAKAVANTVISKIKGSNWPLQYFGGSIIQIQDPGNGEITHKRVPRNMARMVAIHQKHLKKEPVDYVSMLNEMCYIGFEAGLKNQNRWTAIRGRHQLTKDFYQLFHSMVRVSSCFSNHRNDEIQPEDERLRQAGL
ncbi:hypothetical protein Lbir_1182 [Legionella birminghamensis]|uniref:Uncharacterized protein n=1 Tax=Legionella birminghamensis TaxID=28083 RepID=A0A378I5U3_9GAMM|nr:hypothetical protein [Legionella birminghamensis]KTC72407.1 hypothetical protein Lbir_1182 [Legionella birminghamensis]STX30539.1 Uncharacterised protein [Legionella birminghamensis]